jgi:hypothetical protein
VVAIVKPWADKLFADRYAPQSLLQQALGGATGIASLARTVPTHLDQILHDLETGNVQVRPLVPVLDTLPDRIHQSASRLGVAIFAASMSIAGVLALPEGLERPMEWVRLTLAILFGMSALTGWTLAWWWHFLAQGKRLHLAPWIRLFRRR